MGRWNKGLLMALIGLVACISMVPAAEAGSSNLYAARSALEAEPGARATFELVLENRGSTNETYAIRLHAPVAAHASASRSNCTVAAGSRCSFVVTARAPEDPQTGFELRVWANSTRLPFDSGHAVLRLSSILPFAATGTPAILAGGRATLLDSNTDATFPTAPPPTWSAWWLAVWLPVPLLRRAVRRNLWLGVLLLSWTVRSTLTEQPTRRRILAAVAQSPGIHIADLRRRLTLGNGNLRHHLRQLQLAGLVRLESDGFRVHVYRTGSPAHRHDWLAETESAIESLARQRPGIEQATLARETGLGKTLTSYYVRRLLRKGVLRSLPAGRTNRLFCTQ